MRTDSANQDIDRQPENDSGGRRETENSLLESEARYRAIVEAFDGLIYICSEDYRIEYMNTRLIERTGRDATGELCYEALHGLKDICPWCVNERVHQGEHVAWEVKSPKDDRWYFIVNTPIRHQDGTISKQAMIQDVTERKEAEQLLEEAHVIISKSPVVAFLWKNDKGWPVEYVTDNVEHLFGHTADDFMSGVVAYSDVVHPDDVERVAREVAQNSRGGGLNEFTHEPYRILTKDGRTVWVDDRTMIRRDDSGAITHYQGVLEDITERIEAQEALASGEAFLDDVINSIQDGISVLDRDMNIIHANRNIEKWYSSHVPLKGKKCYSCYRGRHEPCDPCPLIRAMQSGRTEVEIAPGPPDSPIEWIEVFGYPIKDRKSGEVTGVVEFVRDITEKTRLEQQLLQGQKMKAIGTLAGGLAHDFNNLLMGIQGNASMMLLDVDNLHPHFGYIKGIETAVENAANLTKQLLGFARGGKYEVEPTDMNRVLDDMAEMFGRTRKEIRIVKNFSRNLRAVEVDRRQIETALLNIFINAWQAMPGGGELHIETDNEALGEADVVPHEVEPGPFVRVSVTDTGHGMDEQTRLRAFDPFFTTKERGKGTGLGLASAYGITRNHGGLIDIQSQLGVGTTLRVYLPATDRESVTAPATQPEMRTGTETILLVDDEEPILDIGRQMLEKLGYSVLVASGGHQAVEIYRQHHGDIDLVVLDMIMPDMNGSETFDRIMMMDPDARVLLSSGYSINGRAQDILDRGCSGFIQKPFRMIGLAGKLREILNG